MSPYMDITKSNNRYYIFEIVNFIIRISDYINHVDYWISIIQITDINNSNYGYQ